MGRHILRGSTQICSSKKDEPQRNNAPMRLALLSFKQGFKSGKTIPDEVLHQPTSR